MKPLYLEQEKYPRVAVTGIGLICCLGADTQTCWQRLVEGCSGIDFIRRFDASDCATRIAGELPPEYYDLEKDSFPKKVFRQSTLSSRATLLAARQAVTDAALSLRDMDLEKVAVITGCGGSTYGDELVFAGDGNRPRRRKVPIISHGMLNALSACVTIEFGFKGPSFNVATACASGAFAVGAGFEYVRRTGGSCLAIGVDTLVYEDTIRGFNALMALSERNNDPHKASRPFDKLRDGFVLSEGACALFLEPEAEARARGAIPYALITGYGAHSEAYNIVAPEMSGVGMARAMERALACAAVPKERIGYISAHGTSTYHNDVAETRAIKRVFGERAPSIPISSQKSMIGHSIGAAGAIEVAVCALTLKHQILTPTINYELKDPDCDLDYVPNAARPVVGLHAAISNSFGFGGHNCTIVLERWTEDGAA
uniref:Beta-ketoacyl-[acyl-carrier-protein] synthase family protein n=1 Tax=Desulfacinum infernum TaxID=35837 RepID=A0A832EKF3_9BACT